MIGFEVELDEVETRRELVEGLAKATFGAKILVEIAEKEILNMNKQTIKSSD